MTTARNWFDQGGAAYARFRPEYPPALARFLAEAAPRRDRAVDVGCGNGQLTAQLGEYFTEAIGIDPSADQIANARPHAHVRYICAPAETLPVESGGASLITAAQAAHWFDLDAFYGEARRIAADGALIALIAYGVPAFDAEIQERFSRFYGVETEPYWPPERRQVDAGYADMQFPFAERAAPHLAIDKSWTLDDALGYFSTWSATRRIREAGHTDILTRFADDLTSLWGDAAKARPVTFPIHMRLGAL